MYCERCGTKITQATQVCPACDTPIRRSASSQESTPYTPLSNQAFGGPPPYQKGYQPSPGGPYQQPPYQQAYSNQAGYGSPPPYYGPMPQPQVLVSNKNDQALIVEIILSLFGIFGIGWIMAGETAIGAVLIVCSIFIYWPILIYGTVFTLGIGLICLGPLSIGAIILNILLLNNMLNRKARRFMMMHPPMQMPPHR